MQASSRTVIGVAVCIVCFAMLALELLSSDSLTSVLVPSLIASCAWLGIFQYLTGGSLYAFSRELTTENSTWERHVVAGLCGAYILLRLLGLTGQI